MTMPVVDAHVHAWEMPSPRFPWQPLRGMRPERPAPVEHLLATMAENHVTRAVIVQPSNYGYNHDYVLDCMARHSGVFGVVALFDFRDPDAQTRLASLAQAGIGGVRLYLYHEPDLDWVDDDRMDGIVTHAGRLGMVITVFGRWDMLAPVAALARRHPGTPFVLDHLGHPDLENVQSWQAVLDLANLPNVSIKMSDFPTVSRQPFPYADLRPYVREIHAAFGAERMMWASNYPHVLRSPGYEQALTLVDTLLPSLSPFDRAQILGGTAARLWRLTG